MQNYFSVINLSQCLGKFLKQKTFIKTTHYNKTNNKMANTKSAIKAIRSSAQKNSINKSRKNRIRTFIRKVVDEIKLGNKENAKQALKNLEPELMRGVTKKVYKLNTASRKLSRLYAAVNKINSPAQ